MDNYRQTSVVWAHNADTEANNEFYTNNTGGSDVLYNFADEDDQTPVTAAQVERIIRAALSEMKIYVLEADITDAQNAVKAVVEKSIL